MPFYARSLRLHSAWFIHWSLVALWWISSHRKVKSLRYRQEDEDEEWYGLCSLYGGLFDITALSLFGCRRAESPRYHGAESLLYHGAESLGCHGAESPRCHGAESLLSRRGVSSISRRGVFSISRRGSLLDITAWSLFGVTTRSLFDITAQSLFDIKSLVSSLRLISTQLYTSFYAGLYGCLVYDGRWKAWGKTV